MDGRLVVLGSLSVGGLSLAAAGTVTRKSGFAKLATKCIRGSGNPANGLSSQSSELAHQRVRDDWPAVVRGEMKAFWFKSLACMICISHRSDKLNLLRLGRAVLGCAVVVTMGSTAAGGPRLVEVQTARFGLSGVEMGAAAVGHGISSGPGDVACMNALSSRAVIEKSFGFLFKPEAARLAESAASVKNRSPPKSVSTNRRGVRLAPQVTHVALEIGSSLPRDKSMHCQQKDHAKHRQKFLYGRAATWDEESGSAGRKCDPTRKFDSTQGHASPAEHI